MAFIDLGKLKFNWRGEWQSSSTYEVDDVVYYDSQTWVASADIAASQAEPQANPNWDLMAAGLNFRGVYDGATTYYLHDLVTYGSALYILEDIGQDASQTGEDPGGSSAASQNWKVMTPAPDANVLHASGDMVYRNNLNNTARLVITEQVGNGITVQEEPLESYTSRAFTYEENGDYGNSINTPGSIPAETYTQTLSAQRDGSGYSSGSYVITGSDRDGVITKKHDPTIRINVGDTLIFNNSMGAHPLDIRVADGGAQVTTGTLTGAGVAGTVEWDTTGVTAGTYYYQCTSHAGMVGQIVVTDTTNRLGSASGNGTINVCRGKTYTITFSGNLSNGQIYDLYTTAGGHSTANDSVTAAEGNSAFTSTTNSGVAWTTGSTVTITFTPNETTPNTVYIGNRNSAMTNNLIINVNDVAYVPSWGTAAASAVGDNREFKHWQDFYGADSANNETASSRGTLTTDATRDPGSDVKVSGTAVGAQQRRISRTAGTATWTVPDGVEKIRITCIGGGGGGGSYNTSYRGGEGGGGGAFASGEFNVTEGEQLTITAGLGGHGQRASTGANGGTSSVVATAAFGGAAHISVSAEGGNGGFAQNNDNGKAGNTTDVSGSDLVAGTTIRNVGGRGGWGATTGAGWPSVGHVTGGGGSAGSMFGPGHMGGSSNSGSPTSGLHYANCGGAGIGGPGGHGVTNYSPSDVGYASGGGGGGSGGPGQNGDGSGAVSPSLHMNAFGTGGKGGAGLMPDCHEFDNWNEHMPFQVGESAVTHFQRSHAEAVTGHPATDFDTYSYWQMCGGRYGDGEATSPAASSGWVNGNSMMTKKINYVGETKQAHTINYSAKAFNGVLGRLWGGGGAGGNRTNANPAGSGNSCGGCGGAGAGGGGSYSYSTTGHTVDANAPRGDADAMTSWDPINLAYRFDDKYCVQPEGAVGQNNIYTGTNMSVFSWGPGRANGPGSGNGGHGGALGGGGGGSYGSSQGGSGGIGGGGGGGSNRYSPNNAFGFGGNGGPGYVLIEWE